MPRIKMALLGNCQVQTYRALLPAMVDAPLDLVVLDVSEAASRDPTVQRAFLADAATCDIIVAQRTNFDLINDEQLRATLPGRLLTIGNFYFRGLQPDSCYVGDFEHRFDRPSSVHSVVILDAFHRGFDIQQAMARFTQETFAEMGLFDAWQSSLDEMAAREADGAVDVPCLALMRDACRQAPAFLTMNHPSIALLAAYLEQVLE
ncbi:MAG: hypothetical protein J0H99_25635, partial [Rhodospirillales bacterium]|nr:hypothetical protein [Rhodospirillales bacterium]